MDNLRYVISGEQLYLLHESPQDIRREEAENIKEKQCLGKSNNNIVKDVELIQRGENGELSNKLQDVPEVLFFQTTELQFKD